MSKTKVTRIGLPAEYMVHTNGQPDLDWVREVIRTTDLDYINSFDIIINSYFDQYHEGLKPQYLTKAIRIPTEDLKRLQDFSEKTGMTIKLITHMILSIAYAKDFAEGGE